MKKFGTPNGAAPGIENENVGFAAVGTPGPVGPLGVFAPVVVFGLVVVFGPVVFGPVVPVGDLRLLPVGPLTPPREPPP
jgi:hypothetical protein